MGFIQDQLFDVASDYFQSKAIGFLKNQAIEYLNRDSGSLGSVEQYLKRRYQIILELLPPRFRVVVLKSWLVELGNNQASEQTSLFDASVFSTESIGDVVAFLLLGAPTFCQRHQSQTRMKSAQMIARLVEGHISWVLFHKATMEYLLFISAKDFQILEPGLGAEMHEVLRLAESEARDANLPAPSQYRPSYTISSRIIKYISNQADFV